MKILAVVNQKGGVGKTTVSVNLASELSDDGETVLIDADRQASALGWISRCPSEHPYPARCFGQVDPASLRLLRETESSSWAIIDGPPSLESPIMSAALEVADLAVIPINPSIIDLASMMETTVTSVNDALRKNPSLLFAVLINRRQAGTVMALDVRAALEAESIPVFTTEWTLSSAHTTAAAKGIPVRFYRGWNWRAAYREVESLAREIREVLS